MVFYGLQKFDLKVDIWYPQVDMRYPWLPMLSLLGMGFYIAIAIVLGIWGGHWLDVKLIPARFIDYRVVFWDCGSGARVYNMIKPFMEEAKKADNNKKDKDIK